MMRQNFEKIDLLGLCILVKLYENHSATTTSKELKISAPKISRYLKALREAFSNELFIRSRYGLCPNEFTAKIYPIAKTIIDNALLLEQINPLEFDAAEPYSILIHDAIACEITTLLVNQIKRDTANIQIAIHSSGDHSELDVAHGKASLAICYSSGHKLVELQDKIQIVFSKPLSNLYLLCRDNHPILSESITIESIAKYPFINTEWDTSETKICSYQQFCKINNINIHKEITIHNTVTLIDYIMNSDALVVTPFSTLYNKSEKIPNLHSCKLSKVETQRVFDIIATPNIYLIKSKHNQDNNIDYLQSRLIELIDTEVE